MIKKKIFLVEDDVNFGSVMKSYLEMNDFDVEWVNDGKHAVDTFKKGFYDLCVLDVMLPHVDGFTIGSEIKKSQPSMPIVFLTAKTLKEDQSVNRLKKNIPGRLSSNPKMLKLLRPMKDFCKEPLKWSKITFPTVIWI